MFIWSGLGFLAALIPVAFFILCAVVFGIAGKDTALDNPMVGLATAALLSSAMVWWLGRKLNTAPGRELIDPNTNQRVILRRRHTMFWIPMEWWSIGIALIAIIAIAGIVLGKH